MAACIIRAVAAVMSSQSSKQSSEAVTAPADGLESEQSMLASLLCIFE